MTSDHQTTSSDLEIATDNLPSRELLPVAEPAADHWQILKALLLDAVTSQHSRRSYEVALDGFITWWEREGKPPFTKATVRASRAKLEGDGLAAATINVRLSAIRKLAVEAADNGLLESRPGCGHWPRERREAAWRSHGQLVDACGGSGSARRA